MPEGADQRWTPPHATQGTARVMTELGEIARAEVGQFVMLPVAPEVLHRIEFRRVGRQLLDRAMDWLLPQQARIEQALAKRQLRDATLALYDVSSTYFEGRCCPLARYGYSRDGKRDKLQISFGLLTNADGCPVAVEVFEGNTADPHTVGSVLTKLRERFALKRIVLVGDRGLLTSARIRDDLAPLGGLDWITAACGRRSEALPIYAGVLGFWPATISRLQVNLSVPLLASVYFTSRATSAKRSAPTATRLKSIHLTTPLCSR